MDNAKLYRRAVNGSGLPFIPGRRFRRTGEFRAPLKGELYISGAVPEVYRAPNDLSTPYHIATPA